MMTFKNKNSFSIEDLEPFFKDKFKISIPSNLKPVMLVSTKDLDLTEEEQLKIDTYAKKYFELEKRNRIANNLFVKRDHFSVRPHWLANDVGKANQHRGLTKSGLNHMPVGVFQMGQEDSNTKGYFIYTSTTINRRVRLRFGLWNQYNMELHRSNERLESLQRFFQNFEHFENKAKGSTNSLFLFFDEYGETEINIELKNGERIIKDRGFGGKFHTNYDFFLELLKEIEIKSIQ